jgi:hypothetical protein
MSKEREATKERDLETVIVESQPKFLKAVQETYYLAVLGSLCIAVSAFTQQAYPQAQAYAITGASLFLLAFFCSFIAKLFPSAFLIMPSYIATGAGIVMLFLVTLEFYNALTIVSKAFTVIMIGVAATLIATIPYNLYILRKKSISVTKHLLTISVVLLSMMLISFLIISVPSLILGSNPFLEAVILVSVWVFSITTMLGLGSTVTAISMLIFEKRRRKKEITSKITFVDEGSGL